MCQYMNEADGVIQFLVERIKHLEQQLEESQLRSIEARNPGIDIEEVRSIRAKSREDRLCPCGDFSYYNNGTCGPNGCFNRPA